MAENNKVVSLPGVVSVNEITSMLAEQHDKIECIVGVVIYKEKNQYVELFCSDMTHERMAYCSIMMDTEVKKYISQDPD